MENQGYNLLRTIPENHMPHSGVCSIRERERVKIRQGPGSVAAQNGAGFAFAGVRLHCNEGQPRMAFANDCHESSLKDYFAYPYFIGPERD